ncbi:MAG: hypothetical protein L0H15_06030 [Nitrosospira sp.]|nr:hypothetical protein [Nitrosospira sp.]MDN5936646.1 hypothetical protein [Nitrosospira sp.]
MRIENIRSETTKGRIRRLADIVWENNARQRQTVWFETGVADEDFLSGSANSFLVGAAIPALGAGERRVSVDAPVCPELKQNLNVACRILSQWYGHRQPPPEIEADVLTSLPPVLGERSTGIFLSGGIDSSASLRANRLQVPRSYPSSVTHGVLVFGYDIGAYADGDANADQQRFEHALGSARAIAEDAELELVLIHTNIRHLNEDLDFWLNYYFGAFLASVAHQLDRKLQSMIINSGPDISTLAPHGSHPLLDPYYGTASMNIIHHGIEYTRLEKTRLVADWPVGFANLRVCTRGEYVNGLNCGICEKCVRTMVALQALGRLSGCGIFPQQEVDPDFFLRKTVISDVYPAFCYEECLSLLDARGEQRLAAAIRTNLRIYQRSKRHRLAKWTDMRRLRHLAWKLDRAYTQGLFYQMFRKVTGRS